MLRDFLVIAALLGVAASVLAWLALRKHGPHNDRLLGGPNVNVSQHAWAQSEVSAAVDLRNPRILLAGSNDVIDQNRVYSSTDGGATWDSRPGPPLPDAHPCGLGDPAVAIGPDGRQYYALLIDATCDRAHLHLYVATRAGPHDAWHTRRVEPHPRIHYLLDDKPALVVDDRARSRNRGRAYLAWSKWYSESERAIAVSHSDDGGVTWSTPVAIARGDVAPFPAALAVGPGGIVYLSFAEAFENEIYVTRSTNGGKSFVWLTPDLVAAPPAPVGPPDSMPADQFWPALAVDRTTGDIWVCYYDTTGDRGRRNTWFTCTVSRDGVHWAQPARAAEDPSDESVQRADLNEYGDYEAVVATGGVAHAFWTDSSDPLGKDEEIFTAAIPASELRR